MPEPKWLTDAQIVRLNEMIVERTGERHLLRSEDLLGGALARPTNLFAYEGEEDLIVLAVRLFEGIARNHCFEQGKKRTAFHAAAVFLELNGVFLHLKDAEANAVRLEQCVAGELSVETIIADWRAVAEYVGAPKLQSTRAVAANVQPRGPHSV